MCTQHLEETKDGKSRPLERVRFVCGQDHYTAATGSFGKHPGKDGRTSQHANYRLDSSCTIASTILSMVSVTRLLGRLKLFERMEKARWSPLMVVA